MITFLNVLFFNTVYSQIDSAALKTPEGVAAQMLKFISFEKDEVKDWEDYRSLFLPSAQKMSFRPINGESLSKQVRANNIEEFIRYAGPNYSKKGFEEYVIGLDVKKFNGIASVFQSFYCRTLDDSYEARGVNAYQLVYLNERWWIASVIFINESEDEQLPKELLFEKYQVKD